MPTNSPARPDSPSRPDATRPIIGIENRTAQEVFDMMCDRIRYAKVPDLIAHIERLEAGLREIMKPGCGAGLDWADDELISYWFSQANRCRSIARATLSQGKTHE